MITISLCMIVKNEEDVLSRCLNIMKDLVDEIIIVDTGSDDNTKDIAKAYTSDIYDFKWIDDFSAARNYCFSKASKDYIFWLDADDVLLEEDREKFKKLKESLDTKIDGVMMRYNTGFDINGNVLISCYRQRLVKRINHQKWEEPVHEFIPLKGTIYESDICVNHYKISNKCPSRNITIFEKQIEQRRELSLRGLYYYSRELYIARDLEKSKKFFHKYLDMNDGWIEDRINACLFLAQCYYETGDKEGRIQALLRSFIYDIPRAEICCEIGKYFIDIEQYEKAIYWLKYALQLEKPLNNWGFVLHDYYEYIPYINLCVCYDRLGNFKEANYYNEKAAEYRPGDSHVVHNKKYFEDKKVQLELLKENLV